MVNNEFRSGRASVSTDRTISLDGSLNTALDDGEDGRDRIGVHGVWELILLIGTAVVAVLAYRYHPAALKGDALHGLLIDTATIGLLALGVGLSTRAAAPNLAVGPLAVVAAMVFAHESSRGVVPAALIAIGAAVGAALALAVVVVALHVPAWAASLALALGLIAWLGRRGTPATVSDVVGYNPVGQAPYWFAAFAGLAVIGGGLGLMSGVRRNLARFRPTGDPASRRYGRGALTAALAVTASGLFAGLGGVLLAVHDRTVVPGDGGLLLSTLALGAVLLGGTSAYGRRGGVLGTLLGVTILALVTVYLDAAPWRQMLVGAGAIGLGLAVTRAVEAFGRPRPGPAEVEEEYEPADDWRTTTPGGWTAPPARRDPDDDPWQRIRQPLDGVDPDLADDARFDPWKKTPGRAAWES